MTCPTGKIQHPTRDAALAQQKALVYSNYLRGRDEESVGLNVYACHQCQAFHVGRWHDDTPPIYHYTVKRYLADILKADSLKPPKPYMLLPFPLLPDVLEPEFRAAYPDGTIPLTKAQVSTWQKYLPDPVPLLVDTGKHTGRKRRRQVLVQFPKDCVVLTPLLWFSRNSDWEHSVIKTEPPNPPGRVGAELLGRGLLRFAVHSSVAKLRWSDYLALNETSRQLRDGMAKIGDPTEWLATDEPVPLNQVRAIEVYYGERGWVSVGDVDDDAFDRYIAGRLAVYQAARESLNAKLTALHDQIQPIKGDDAAVHRLVAACLAGLTEAEAILQDDQHRRP